MFGDFITYAFDQLINNASKMFHMYNHQVSCPVVIRTPMGGRRGYGPTHSQSLERFLIGIDNCCTISLNSLVPVDVQLGSLNTLACPIILLENKSDYTLRTFIAPPQFFISISDALIPTIRVAPIHSVPTVTIVAYGGMARFVADRLMEIFDHADCVPELLVPVSLSPPDLRPIQESVKATQRLLIIEEGASFGSLGAEIVARLSEDPSGTFQVRRVGGRPTPIPSAPALEAACLPNTDDICEALLSLSSQDLLANPYPSSVASMDMRSGELCQ
jgi:2-oxoisovalerate dehydrogenase E1 component